MKKTKKSKFTHGIRKPEHVCGCSLKGKFLKFLTRLGEPHASIFHTSHNKWYNCLFGHHTRWQIWLTNTVKWYQRKHDLRQWWKTRPWQRKKAPEPTVMESFGPYQLSPTSPPYSWQRRRSHWDVKEIGLGFSPKLELKLLKKAAFRKELIELGLFRNDDAIRKYESQLHARNSGSH
jgi:hypothetical protein